MTIDINPNVRIPLADGVTLSAILFRPSDEIPPVPAVFTLSPYTADNYFTRGKWLAEHGLAFLAVDTRGRGNSEGTFDPFRQELADGHDIVEWIAAQPFCNGKVGMAGGSYCGTSQWATASRNPPHLATIVPTASAHAGVDFPARTGIGYQYILQWLAFVNGNALQSTWFADTGFWRRLWRSRYERGASFGSLESELGGLWPLISEWIDRIENNDFADYMPTDQQIAVLDIPILTITGSYDDDQPGALAYYRRHLELAKAESAAKHYLLIGPWDHAGTRTPTARVGGVEMGDACLIDMDQLHLDWFNWTMGNGERPALLEKRVTYYVMGAERWRHGDTLEDATARHIEYVLDSSGQASDLFISGTLAPGRTGSGKPDLYIYDPRDVSIAEVEQHIDNEDPAEQRMVFARNGRQLVYHTAPFEKPTEITGFFRLDVWLSIDTPDTDFAVRVYEVSDAGRAILLTSDLLRARHREGRKNPALIPGPEPLQYIFDDFTWVSRELAKGSRLRLTIGPNDSIYAQKNFNSGGVVSEETMEDARTVTVRLFHDADHVSALSIPFGNGDAE